MMTKDQYREFVEHIVQVGRKAAGCMTKCAHAGRCLKIPCSLDIPSDNEVSFNLHSAMFDGQNQKKVVSPSNEISRGIIRFVFV